jgi:hypothetical protein
MLISSLRRFRCFIVVPILALLISFAPYSGLLFPYASRLFSSLAYAEEYPPPPPPPGTAPVEVPPPGEAVVPEPPPEGVPPDEAVPPEEGKDKLSGKTQQSPMAMMSTGAGGGGGSLAGVSLPALENSLFSGAGVATIPIEVPPGRKDVAPKLALRYNSYQGNGWLGVGWTLDMGSIQRSTKWGVNYGNDTTNAFVAIVNGSSFDLIPRSEWGANYYGAKIEGALMKFYRHPTSGWWEVTTKDGTKYRYGYDTNSRQDFDSGQKVFK